MKESTNTILTDEDDTKIRMFNGYSKDTIKDLHNLFSSYISNHINKSHVANVDDVCEMFTTNDCVVIFNRCTKYSPIVSVEIEKNSVGYEYKANTLNNDGIFTAYMDDIMHIMRDIDDTCNYFS